MYLPDNIKLFASTHQTSNEIALAIFEIADEGQEERLWREPHPLEEQAVIKRAWQLAGDSNNQVLHWGDMQYYKLLDDDRGDFRGEVDKGSTSPRKSHALITKPLTQWTAELAPLIGKHHIETIATHILHHIDLLPTQNDKRAALATALHAFANVMDSDNHYSTPEARCRTIYGAQISD